VRGGGTPGDAWTAAEARVVGRVRAEACCTGRGRAERITGDDHISARVIRQSRAGPEARQSLLRSAGRTMSAVSPVREIQMNVTGRRPDEGMVLINLRT
jgi:hypothetical protein